MKKLYEGNNIRRNDFYYSFPLVLTALLSQAYQIINTIMAGKLIGDAAISAIGSTSPLIQLISSLFWGYGSGFTIYVAMLFGKGDYKKMINVIKINLTFMSLIIITLSTLLIVFYKNIFSFLNIEQSISKEAFSYYSIYLAGLVFLNFGWCGVYISNALGLTILPLFASVISNVINIAGNYILIRFFDMGVMGTAIATIFAAVCVSIFYFCILIREFKKEGIKTGGFYIEKSELKSSFNFGVPSMLQQSVMYICTALVSPLTNLCGTGAIAGYTVGMRLYDLNAGVYQNSNKTVSNFIAQCIGAGKYRRIKEGIKAGLVQTMIFLLPFLFLTIFCATPVSKVFLSDKESIHYAKVFMQFCMPFVLFNVINNLLHGIFRSVGAGKYLVFSTVVYSISRFGFSYLLYDKYEMYGIYAAIVLAWVTEAIFGMIIYFSGKWKSPEYREKEMQ